MAFIKVALITLLSMLLVGECGLRIVGYENPSFYRYDDRRGWALRPGAEGWWRSEGESYVVINSRGLRDREHGLDKPEGSLRVAVLGDSFAEALQVPMEDAFWAHLEKGLAGCPRFAGKQVEVVNFGVSSYGTANEYLTLDEVWRYSPDVVLLAFLTANDVLDNSIELDPLTGPRPYYRLENGALVLDSSRNVPPPLSRRAWTAGRDISRVLQLVQQVRSSRAAELNATGGAPGNELGLHDGVYLPPNSAEWERAWAVSEALVGAVADEVGAHGAEFWLATLSNSLQVDVDAAKREAFMRAHGISDLFYPDRRLAAFAKGRNLRVITLAPQLLAIATRDGECLHGFPNHRMCSGHWNARGHRAAGGILASRLCEGR